MLILLGVHWKILFLGRGWGGHKKPISRRNCLNTEGTWTVCKFKRGLGKKEGGGVFERGWYPNAHYDNNNL